MSCNYYHLSVKKKNHLLFLVISLLVDGKFVVFSPPPQYSASAENCFGGDAHSNENIKKKNSNSSSATLSANSVQVTVRAVTSFFGTFSSVESS